MANGIKVFFIAFIVVLLIIGSPILTIWSLNTLFPSLAIPTNLDTWLATIVLSAILSGGLLGTSSKN